MPISFSQPGLDKIIVGLHPVESSHPNLNFLISNSALINLFLNSFVTNVAILWPKAAHLQ